MAPTTRSRTLQRTTASSDASRATAASTAVKIPTDYLTNDVDWEKSKRTRSNRPFEPPRFTIDLSLPPEQRYLEVCFAFRQEMRELTSLFDEIVEPMVRYVPSRLLRFVCWLVLRGVYNKEETAELKGISQATNIEMYLLVCLNVLLDLFMGCSSGGAAVHDGKDGIKMLHFRTLDWGMPALRRIIVQLDYKLSPDGEIVARSLTYAGFVGVLTGVRKDLSMSLNFRGVHDHSDCWTANVRYYWHHLMVLLGYRPSITSLLRACLLSSEADRHDAKVHRQCSKYAEVGRRFAGCLESRQLPVTSTACYLCFCDGKETTIIEKDRVTARVHTDTDFAVVTNGDFIGLRDDGPPREAEDDSFAAALAEIVHEAKDRKECAEKNWKLARIAAQGERGSRRMTTSDLAKLMSVNDVVELVQKFPTTNEVTHFACVMDPKKGDIVWVRAWRRPVGAKWIREHMSEGY